MSDSAAGDRVQFGGNPESRAGERRRPSAKGLARKTGALLVAEHPDTWEAAAPPESEAELLLRAHRLAGCQLGEVALAAGWPVPREPLRAKGWAGCLIERALGARGGSANEPDFPDLAIELKTIPLTRAGRPRESTFVCSVSLREIAETEWAAAGVRRKLARVLWVPIEADPRLRLGERRIGAALLWSPSTAQEAALRADFEQLAGMIAIGDGESLTARDGACLQIRPKGANARAMRRGVDEHGAPVRTPPRAFYLRACFTAGLFGGDGSQVSNFRATTTASRGSCGS
jgi:DNA mismatch repair protein MutH